MPDVKHNVIVPHTAEQMYDLVNDVEKYPEFIPWCSESRVTEPSDTEMKATLCFSAHGFNKAFTTHNHLEKNRRIQVKLLEGPFRFLEGAWHFQDMGSNTSKISVDLSFEFSNRMISMMIGPVFQTAADSLIEAFKNRADEIYGKRIEG